MSVYKLSGELMIGSRLRRLGDRLLADVSRAYGELGIPFEPSWLPLFFLLDRHGELTVSAIADELEITSSGASQMVASLESKGSLETGDDPRDGRVRVVGLTAAGRDLLQQVKPVWEAMRTAVDKLLDGGGHTQCLLSALDELEQSLQAESLADRMLSLNRGNMEITDD